MASLKLSLLTLSLLLSVPLMAEDENHKSLGKTKEGRQIVPGNPIEQSVESELASLNSECFEEYRKRANALEPILMPKIGEDGIETSKMQMAKKALNKSKALEDCLTSKVESLMNKRFYLEGKLHCQRKSTYLKEAEIPIVKEKGEKK